MSGKRGKTIRVGCSGWFYRAWKGVFYPNELPQSGWFSYYSSKFNTVELNSTFYNFPKKERVRRWLKEAPDGFIYAIKAPRIITHLKKFRDCEGYLREFYETIEILGDKLGAVLFQLPPSVKKDHDFMRLLASSLSSHFKNAVEFRHISWFDDETRETLTDSGIAMVAVSAPGFEGIPGYIFGCPEFSYLRLHGITKWYAYDYSDEELRKIAEAVRKCESNEVYVYFNNDVGASAPRNARRLMEFLNKP